MLFSFIKIIKSFLYSFKSIMYVVRWEKDIQILIMLAALLVISSAIFKGSWFEIVARKSGIIILMYVGIAIIRAVIEEQTDIAIDEHINKKPKSVSWIIVRVLSS